MKSTCFIKFKVSEISFEIRVNDVYLVGNKDGGNISSQIASNHLLNPLKNEFSVTFAGVGKPVSEASKCSVQVVNQDTKAVLAEYTFVYDPKKPAPVYNYTGKFDLKDTDITPSLWTRGPAPVLNPALTQGLYRMQHQIIDLFKKGDLDGIMKFFETRDNHFIDRFDLNKTKRLTQVRSYYESFINDNSWKINETDDKTWVLKEYGQKRLYIFETGDRDSPLYYLRDSDKTVFRIQSYYCKQGNDFVCIL